MPNFALDLYFSTIVAHANPGGGLPQWAAKTAVNALAPIEPFKLFHKINVNVQRNQPKLRERLKEAEMVSTMPPGRSPRPGGIAQLGYACYWPNGGGNIEGNSHQQQSQEPSSDVTRQSANDLGETIVEGSSANMDNVHFSDDRPDDSNNDDSPTAAYAIAPDST